jgi:hypothetical protein
LEGNSGLVDFSAGAEADPTPPGMGMQGAVAPSIQLHLLQQHLEPHSGLPVTNLISFPRMQKQNVRCPASVLSNVREREER